MQVGQQKNTINNNQVKISPPELNIPTTESPEYSTIEEAQEIKIEPTL